MATLIDYISWRGDLSFQQDPFNLVDNLLFSCLSYIELDGIMPEDPLKTFTLHEIGSKYFQSPDNQKKIRGHSIINDARDILKAASEAGRYRDIPVRNYVNIIEQDKTMQFSAVEYLIPDGSSYVAYRGTDDTIVGWKEDFLLSVLEVFAEKEAVRYLDRVASCDARPLRIGGHSKGGHLAVYAASKCSSDTQSRIIQVCNNDGPGFTKAFVTSRSAKAILPLLTRILPYESIIGMLMEPVGHPLIVSSINKGPLQHNLTSWEILGPELVTMPDVSRNARIIDTSIKEWFSTFDKETTVLFVNDLFSVLEATGCKTLSQLQKNQIKSLHLMTKRLNELNPETKEKIALIIKTLFHEFIS